MSEGGMDASGHVSPRAYARQFHKSARRLNVNGWITVKQRRFIGQVCCGDRALTAQLKKLLFLSLPRLMPMDLKKSTASTVTGMTRVSRLTYSSIHFSETNT